MFPKLNDLARALVDAVRTKAKPTESQSDDRRRAAAALLEGLLTARWIHLAENIIAINGFASVLWLGIWTVFLSGFFDMPTGGDSPPRVFDVTRLALANSITSIILVGWRVYVHFFDNVLVKLYPRIVEAQQDLGTEAKGMDFSTVTVAPENPWCYWVPLSEARQLKDPVKDLARIKQKRFPQPLRVDLLLLAQCAPKASTHSDVVQALVNCCLIGFRGHKAFDLTVCFVLVVLPFAILFYGLYVEKLCLSCRSMPHWPTVITFIVMAFSVWRTCRTMRRSQRDPTWTELERLKLVSMDKLTLSCFVLPDQDMKR